MTRPAHHKQLARICADAYATETFSIAEIEGVLIDLVIAEKSNSVVIALRGTEFKGALKNGGWFDILRNLFAFPASDGDIGKGHAGFIRSGRAVFEFIRANVDKNQPIICTGHSMGAAIAQVLALMFIREGYTVAEYVGFGSPRVFIGAQDWQGVRAYHYHFGMDIVPMLLPPGVIYRHPSKTIRIGKGRWYPNFSDHAVGNYVDGV